MRWERDRYFGSRILLRWEKTGENRVYSQETKSIAQTNNDCIVGLTFLMTLKV